MTKYYRSRLVLPLIMTLIVVAIETAFSQSNIFVRFVDFSSLDGLTLNGETAGARTSDGNVLRLVPAQTHQSGSVFSSTRVNASLFSSYFCFRFSGAGGEMQGGADGFVFVIQSISNSIGGSGGGMGYAGISNSVGIEFDIYRNNVVYHGNDDPDDSHVAINKQGIIHNTKGVPDSAPPFGSIAAGISPNFKQGDVWHVWIDYAGTSMEVRVALAPYRPTAPTAYRIVNMTNELSSATGFVGFTAGSGAEFANHDILAWQFNSTFDPITNPPKAFRLDIQPDGQDNSVIIDWESKMGYNYRVEMSSNLVASDWTTLTNIIGDGLPICLSALINPMSKVYYRVAISWEEFQSTYPIVTLAGTFNDWSTYRDLMTLTADHTWQTTKYLTNAVSEFKFVANLQWGGPDWGVSGQSFFVPPISGTCVTSGPNIIATNLSTGKYRFTFHDEVFSYSMERME